MANFVKGRLKKVKKVISLCLTLCMLSLLLVLAFAVEPERSSVLGVRTSFGILVDYEEYVYDDGTVGRAYLYEQPTRAAGVKDVTEYYVELDDAGDTLTEFNIHAVFKFDGEEVTCNDWGGDLTYKRPSNTYSAVARAYGGRGDVDSPAEVRFSYTRQPPWSGAARHSGYLYCDVDGNTSMWNY